MKRLLPIVLLLAACAGDPALKGANLAEAARINTQLGIDYARRGELTIAQEKLERAVKEDPNYAMAHSTLAFVYGRLGQDDKAEKAYRRSLAISGNDPSLANNFGTFLCGIGKMSEAEQLFLAAAQNRVYPTPEAAWTNAGVCAKKTDAAKAERFFRSALDANREFPEALLQMALLSHEGKDDLRARAFLQRYELKGLASAEMLWLGYQTESALGDRTAAARYAARLRTEFPESAEAASLPRP